jgi:nucleoside-diphosphate-sugar epimerase
VRCLVTGAAGFIGSHLAQKLVAEGHDVTGIDCFTDYYPRSIKEHNLKGLEGNPRFQFIEQDLVRMDMEKHIPRIDWVFHQAAQAGVRTSWGNYFEHYTHDNILATQSLLEACKGTGIKKFVSASSSSIYGDSEDLPLTEESMPKPISPYGVTKLACEYLCLLYWKNFQVPVINLRYFTVYGPRQRPDMAFNLFIRSILKDEEIVLYGDGEQTRDFTFISDIIEANLLAAPSTFTGETINIGGGSQTSMLEVIRSLGEISGKTVKIKRQEAQKGDVRHTLADVTKARRLIGYNPRIQLKNGLREEYEWLSKNIDLYEKR